MGKSRKGNGFQLVLQQAPKRAADFSGRFLLGLVIFLSIFGCIWNGLSLSGGAYTRAALVAVGALYCLAGCNLSKKWKPAYYIALILLAVYAVIGNRWIIDGWNITVNQIFVGLEAHLGRIFPRYGVDADPGMSQFCETLFLMLPAALLGLTAGWSANGKLAVLLILDGIVILASLLGLYTPDAWTVLLLLATAAVCSRRVTYRNNYSDHGTMTFWILTLLALLATAALLPALLTSDGTAQAEDRRQDAARQIHHLRYERNEQLLPEGDFTKLKDFTPEEDKTVMTVTLPEADSLYLRGFVGERYTGDGWAGLPAARKAKSATVFAWLHARGFYGQNQIALLADALNLETQTIPVAVENEKACTGYRYAPYELKTGEPDPAEIGDADLPAAGLRGERKYEYYVTSCSVANYDDLYTKLLEAWRAGDKDVKEYLESENAYRKYAYANYLDVPQEAEQAVRTLLGGLEVPENGLEFDAAKQVVSACLTNALTYSETPPAYEGGDFLTLLLTDSHAGYSVHYATAETLLFRSLGIPARYVEGYYIAEGEAVTARQAGEPIEIREADAHAWVEIYRDGIGFVPFEITSGTSSMDQSDQSINDDDSVEEEKPPQEPASILSILLWLLIAVTILLVLAVLFLVFRRLWLRRRWKRLMAGCDPNQAVELWTAYIVRLLGFFGVIYRNGSLYRLKGAIAEIFGQETAEAFAAVISIQQQARFSVLPVTELQRDAVRDFAETLTQTLKKRSKWHVRFRLRFWYCVL